MPRWPRNLVSRAPRRRTPLTSRSSTRPFGRPSRVPTPRCPSPSTPSSSPVLRPMTMMTTTRVRRSSPGTSTSTRWAATRRTPGDSRCGLRTLTTRGSTLPRASTPALRSLRRSRRPPRLPSLAPLSRPQLLLLPATVGTTAEATLCHHGRRPGQRAYSGSPCQQAQKPSRHAAVCDSRHTCVTSSPRGREDTSRPVHSLQTVVLLGYRVAHGRAEHR